MTKNTEKPSKEAKALSLFLMAYKTETPHLKETSKRINRMWDLVLEDKLSREEYLVEIIKLLKSFGGYTDIVEKTVKYYIDKTGEWKSQGNDQYFLDAKKVADRLLKK